MKSKSSQDSRREFLVKAATAALTAPLLLTTSAQASGRAARLRHACIGVGGMGWGDLNQFKKHPGNSTASVIGPDCAKCDSVFSPPRQASTK